MVVTTSSMKGRLEEYLAVEDLREFPYLLFLIRVDFVSVAPLAEDGIRAIDEAVSLGPSSKLKSESVCHQRGRVWEFLQRLDSWMGFRMGVRYECRSYNRKCL